VSTPRVDGERLWSDLMTLAAIGALPRGGCDRLALTDADRDGRNLFVHWCREAGLAVSIDAMGNVFARREGSDGSLPPVFAGSHLDTQSPGGKFDGPLGVLAALEVVRTLDRAGITTRRAIEVVNWTNEEGSRFAPPMLCSGVYAGIFSREKVDATLDIDGVRFADAIEAIGWRGTNKAGSTKLSAYFELHIEQGPILEAENKTIGIVTGVQGMRWYEATITGREAHSASTPMNCRSDSLVTAARLILAVREIADAHGPAGLGTIGRLQVRPNSSNVIPGEVFLTVDFRHPQDRILDSMESALQNAVQDLIRSSSTGLRLNRILNCPPVVFDVSCVAAVRTGVEKERLAAREIVSGPGHDAVYVSKVVPTSMIFVPCAGGLSHNEAESITQADATAGAQVLLDAVLALDDRAAV